MEQEVQNVTVNEEELLESQQKVDDQISQEGMEQTIHNELNEVNFDINDDKPIKKPRKEKNSNG